MALINCPECGKQISDKAEECVHCGKGISNNGEETRSVVCEECGTALSSSSRVCFNCGNPVNVRSKFRISKRGVITLCLIIGALAIACACIAAYNSPPVQGYIAKTEQTRAALKASETAFKDAKEAEKNDDYEVAISKYKAVIEEDRSYEQAVDKIAELQDRYKKQLLNEAENYAQNKKYKEAIQNVEKAISALGGTDELTGLKQKYADLKASQYAKIVVTDKISHPKDIQNWIFSPYISVVCDVTNNSDKAIKGIEGKLTVSDLFGKEILRAQCDFLGHDIEHGETITIKDRNFECNEFNDAHMKFFNTGFSDLQFTYDITNVVYTDGTSTVPE